MRIPLDTRRATRHLGVAVARCVRVGDVVFLEGRLGAGKTFLTRAIARGIGVSEAIPIASPTFALIHLIDDGRIPLVHADLYRLSDAAEVDALGLTEMLESGVGLIEWGLRFQSAIADDGITIELEIDPDNGRRMARLGSLGPRGAQILAGIRALAESDAPDGGPDRKVRRRAKPRS